ncbi:MAG TPA: PTS sugar transporter subunit IIA [Gemmatales bacterium]|nr:PTS sugar transporter subunit IIA [Gemmatales bacterium]
MSIRITDFVVKEAINPGVKATTKEAVIRELVSSLKTTGKVTETDEENIVKAIMRREQLGSTGIGRGVAIPHAKHESVGKLIGSIGLAPAGIPFESLDNDPVNIFVMLLYAPERPGEHLRALEAVSRLLRDEKFCQSLLKCTTREEIWHLLCEADGVK